MTTFSSCRELREENIGFRLLKNDVNPDLHLPFVTCSRSGPALEVTGLWISHAADGNAAAGPWKGFWGGVVFVFFQPTHSGKNKLLFS